MSRSFSTGRPKNPFDDDDSGFGGSRSRSGGRDYDDFGGRGRARSGNSGGYGGDYGYGGTARAGYSADRERGGYAGGRDTNSLEEDEYSHRIQTANRRMEEASSQSLRTLNDCLHMGSDTAEELERQAESLDRTERCLDEMHVELDQSKKHMRQIKSPFGGIGNYFARRKKVEEVTDPKLPKGSSQGSQKSQSSASSAPPPSMNELQGTGNVTVDRNCTEMSKALYQLKGMGELIGEQLNDSSAQIDRIQYKVERTDTKIKGVNKDIRRQL